MPRLATILPGWERRYGKPDKHDSVQNGAIVPKM